MPFSSRARSPENPNEPHEEYLSFQSAAAAARSSNTNPNSTQQQQQLMATTLASKPHSFSGAVLTPEHAKSLTAGHVLSLASSLSLQAGNAAQVSIYRE